MKPNHHKHQRGGACQDLHNFIFQNNVPEPTLWNSQLGRRQFLGKVGKAGVGTALALNSFKLEAVASGSARHLLTITRTYNASGTAFTQGGAQALAQNAADHLDNTSYYSDSNAYTTDPTFRAINPPTQSPSPFSPTISVWQSFDGSWGWSVTGTVYWACGTLTS